MISVTIHATGILLLFATLHHLHALHLHHGGILYHFHHFGVIRVSLIQHGLHHLQVLLHAFFHFGSTGKFVGK
jgi:hypothetical protein